MARVKRYANIKENFQVADPRKSTWNVHIDVKNFPFEQLLVESLDVLPLADAQETYADLLRRVTSALSQLTSHFQYPAQ